MALAYDTSVGTSGNGANSITLPAITTAGANEILFIGAHTSNNASVTSITGGLTWTLVGTASAGASNGRVELWKAFSTATLSAIAFTINFQATNPQSVGVCAALSGGSRDGGHIAQFASQGGTAGTSNSITYLSTSANSLGIGFIGQTNNNVISAGTNQTAQSQQTSAGGFSRGTILTQNATTATSGTAVTMNGTWTNNSDTGLIIVEVMNAPGVPQGNKLRPHAFSPGIAR